MSRDQRRYLLVALLLAAAALVALVITQGPDWLSSGHGQGKASGGPRYQYIADIDNWQRTDRERIVASPYNFSLSGDLAEVPMTLGDWTGVDVPQTNLEVFIFLEPEQYVQRLYRLADGRSLYLSLIGSRKSKSFHSPQICYDTDGWQTDATSEVVPLAGGEVYALRLVATKQVAGGGTATHIVLYFFLWPGSARNPQDGTVLVKLTAPLYGSLEETLALEKGFFRLLFSGAQR